MVLVLDSLNGGVWAKNNRWAGAARAPGVGAHEGCNEARELGAYRGTSMAGEEDLGSFEATRHPGRSPCIQ